MLNAQVIYYMQTGWIITVWKYGAGELSFGCKQWAECAQLGGTAKNIDYSSFDIIMI